MAILAAGVGFALRGGIFDNWGKEYGFTGAQLGAIGGAGFSGFCFGIIIGGVIVDKIGYGKLVALALLCHVLSAFVTFGASTPENAYSFLFWGMFIFAYANGTLEAVANPLVATLFPENRTHYLNILHASWPAGMVLGSVAGWILDDKMQLGWKIQLALYLVPTVLYAIMFLGQKFPKSEAAAKGSSFVQMFKPVGILGAIVACYLLSLFFGDISKAFSPDNAKTIGYGIGGLLLIAVTVITKGSIGSFLLFVLFGVHALVGAVELGTDGWIQNITGNLFTSEQGKYLFIWTSAIMSIMGGIGMLSAGLIGGPGLGYCKDRFAGEELQKANPALYAEYKAEKPSTFLNLKSTEAFGLDGKKLGEAKDAKTKSASQQAVVTADQKGDRATLKADSFIPLTMAGIYLLLLIYFKGIGGYKAVKMDDQA
jgi:MFS family permease